MTVTFRDYLMSRRVTDTPAGDFVGDAKSDKKFPDAQTWDEVETYLIMRGADAHVRGIGKEVWNAYERQHR